jgi:hypothetical protein
MKSDSLSLMKDDAQAYEELLREELFVSLMKELLRER